MNENEERDKFPDIRERKWRNTKTPDAKVMNLLVEVEDILVELDSIQMENNQCYPELEDFMLQVSDLRNKYSKFVDQNMDVLKIKYN